MTIIGTLPVSPLENSTVWTELLPDYSPADDTPDYTPEPRPDEERLEINRRVRQEESGVYIAQNRLLTLALSKQSPGCKQPTYGRGACVQGMITLNKTEGIMSVEAKLQGELEIIVTSAVINGDKVISIFNDFKVLYKKPGKSTQAESKRTSFFNKSHPISLIPPSISTEKCPGSMTFDLRIPTTYSHEGYTYVAPPSFSGTFGSELPGIPAFLGICVNIRYTLQLTIVKRGSLVDKKSVLTVPISHLPRSRPARPSLPPALTFTSTLKVTPEEWKLFNSVTGIKLGHPNDTPLVSASLLLPYFQVYPLGESIPFHLQLSSDSAKMLAPYATVTNFTDHPSVKGKESHVRLPSGHVGRLRTVPVLEPEVARPQSSAGSSITKSLLQNSQAVIHLSVQRHVAVEFMGQWMQLKQCMSRVTMKPPVQLEGEEANGRTTVAWEGVLDVLDHHQCSGFFGPGIRVRDFIWLCIKGPRERFPLLDINQLVPIWLTTEPYTEERILGMEIAYSVPAASSMVRGNSEPARPRPDFSSGFV